MRYEIVEEAGREFGEQLAQRFNFGRVTFVEVASVDVGVGVANVFIFNENNTFPVPLSLFGTEDYGFFVVPTVGTSALIAYIDGDVNRPIFLKITQVDKVVLKRSNTSIALTVDPEDSTKDEVSVVVGESSIRVTNDTIEMNGGALDGLVIVGKLTERLNQLQSEINQIQSAISGHTHTVATTGSATAQTGTTTGTMYSTVALTQVQNSDYENEKITQ